MDERMQLDFAVGLPSRARETRQQNVEQTYPVKNGDRVRVETLLIVLFLQKRRLCRACEDHCEGSPKHSETDLQR